MANAPDSSTISTPAELVQARIDEKRLFEARFLFHKFSSSIEPQVSLQLEQLLKNGIAQAGQHFSRGQQLEEQQHYEEAERAYGRVLSIAVDYPAIDQALQRIVVACKFGCLQAPSSPVAGRKLSKQAVPVATSGTVVPGKFCLRRRWKILVFFFFLVFVGSAAMLLTGRGFLGFGSSEPPSENSVTSGGIPIVPQAINAPAEMLKSFHGEKGQVEKMTKIVLPRIITPPILQDVTAPPVKAGLVVRSTHKKKLLVQQVAVEEQRVIRAVVPLQEQVVKVLVDTNEVLVVEKGSETAKNAATRKKKKTGKMSVKDGKLSKGTIKIRTYNVQAGDTLEAIAGRVYGDRSQWFFLVQANRKQLGHPPYVLTVGTQLVIPPRGEAAKMHSVSSRAVDGVYTVVSGDSLGVIARKVYGSSRRWQRLYELNRDRLSSPSALRVGQKLRTRKEPDASVDSDPVGE